ncbi:MAG: PilZ domain-containing protein [bacterium]|nr:MAG: PilZ domain-containing protein [bacterium]
MNHHSDRRQSQRILFEKKHDIMAHFSITANPGKSVVVHIMNMSLGGIFFTIRANRDVRLKVGDNIIFENIRKADSKFFTLKLEAEIIWIMNDSDLEYIGVGSKFINLDDEKTSRLQDCIHYCRVIPSSN